MKALKVAYLLLSLNAACGSQLEFKGSPGELPPRTTRQDAPQAGVTPTPSPIENPVDTMPTPEPTEPPVEPTVAPTSAPTQPPVVPLPTPVATEAPVGAVYTESFDLDKKKKPVDMVWVIDNSSSMDNNVAEVRKNFEAFIDSIENKADLKLALVSEKGTSDAKMSLSAKALSAGHIQVSAYVGSYTPMMVAAAASCQKNLTSISDYGGGTVCGLEVNNTDWAVDVIDDAGVNKAAGTLANFYRNDAEKVFVFVTDDDAHGFGATEFTHAMKQARGVDSFRAYSFGCNDTQGSCDGNVGEQYRLLAQNRGAIFDIRNSWAQNFGLLTAEIYRLGTSEYKLGKKDVIQILEVKLGNTVLLPSDYELIEKSRLSINSSVVSDLNAKLTVTYQAASH